MFIVNFSNVNLTVVNLVNQNKRHLIPVWRDLNNLLVCLSLNLPVSFHTILEELVALEEEV